MDPLLAPELVETERGACDLLRHPQQRFPDCSIFAIWGPHLRHRFESSVSEASWLASLSHTSLTYSTSPSAVSFAIPYLAQPGIAREHSLSRLIALSRFPGWTLILTISPYIGTRPGSHVNPQQSMQSRRAGATAALCPSPAPALPQLSGYWRYPRALLPVRSETPAH